MTKFIRCKTDHQAELAFNSLVASGFKLTSDSEGSKFGIKILEKGNRKITVVKIIHPAQTQGLHPAQTATNSAQC